MNRVRTYFFYAGSKQLPSKHLLFYKAEGESKKSINSYIELQWQALLYPVTFFLHWQKRNSFLVYNKLPLPNYSIIFFLFLLFTSSPVLHLRLFFSSFIEQQLMNILIPVFMVLCFFDETLFGVAGFLYSPLYDGEMKDLIIFFVGTSIDLMLIRSFMRKNVSCFFHYLSSFQ